MGGVKAASMAGGDAAVGTVAKAATARGLARSASNEAAKGAVAGGETAAGTIGKAAADTAAKGLAKSARNEVAKSPELQVWTEAVPVVAPVLLTPTSSSAVPCSPGIAALLDEENVHDVGVTDRFVRIRFEPGTPVTRIEHAWDALEVALAALEREAIDGGAPYRG